MVSNKLSARRQTAAKPPGCISKKILPPIIAPVWPPITFPLHLVARWWQMPTSYRIDVSVTFNLTGIPNRYYADYRAPPVYVTGWWITDPITSTAQLSFIIRHGVGFCILQANNIPINWGVPTAYSVGTWSLKIPPTAWALATFNF